MLLVTIASNAVGYGHLNRCLSIAAHAQAAGAEIGFLLFGDEQARARVETAGHSCRVRPISELEQAIVTAASEAPADAVVSDLLHPAFFARTRSPLTVFRQLRSLGRVVAAIDTLGDQSLVAQAPQADIDLMVIPYVAPAIDRGRGQWRLLQGAQYALLSSDYVDLPPRTARVRADRVLVSCGGSDPSGYTTVVLQGLERMRERLQIRIVVGPLFSAALRAQIGRLAARSKHKVELVLAPESLLGEMLWCDLALAASGLTKYELAASGTPALLFSIDASHDAINRPFAAMGSVLDLGENVTPESVCEEAGKLLGDVARRAKMTTTGRKMVDARGAQRLLTEIRKELSC